MPPSLIAAFTPATAQAATAARPHAEASGDAFARQLEQLRQARDRVPVAATMPSLAAQARATMVQRAPTPQATNGSQAPQPAAPRPAAPEKPAAQRPASAPHRNESKPPAPSRQATASGDTPQNAAAVQSDGESEGGGEGHDKAATTDTTDTATPTPPTPASVPTATARADGWLGLPGVAGEAAAGASTPTTDAAATATQDLLAGRSRATPGTEGLNDAGLPVADDGQAAQTAGTVLPSWQQLQAQASQAEAAVARLTGERAPAGAAEAVPASTGPSLGALGATTGLTGTGARPVDAAQVNLATPTTSPEFRSALGVQVSLLAKGGIQQARLHLNPADMGPVTVQILLEGRQAHIHFGAESAQTRQLIESGMPELATALRDAGLTLSGGGVTQHGAGQRDDAAGRSSHADGTGRDDDLNETDAVTSSTPGRRPVHLNSTGLDLYA